MRLGIRGKQIAGVTAIVGLAIIGLSAINVARLAGVVLRESHARGQLIADAIFHRAREVVASSREPYEALRANPGLRAILESSIYGESVTGAAILNADGVIVAHSDPTQIGRTLPAREDLALIADQQGAFRQLRVLYSQEGQTLEVRQQMLLGDEVFGSIRIGVSTPLMRQEVNASLRPALVTALLALGVAVVVAALLAQLLLKPIHVIRGGLTRLGQGELGVTLDLPPGDEFGELGAFFNTVSQQFSANRPLQTEKIDTPQGASVPLEDAVALFSPSGALLFSSPQMQATLPVDGFGKTVGSLLPATHPFRSLVEQTLEARASQGPARFSAGSGAGAPDSDPAQEADQHLALTHAISGTSGELVGVLLVARNLGYLSRVRSTIAHSRKLVGLGRLSAGVAHEVKNPLNAMMIHLELLRTKIQKGALSAVPQPEAVVVASGGLGLAAAERGPSLTETGQVALQHVEVIEGEIRRLDEVVQGFLRFTRPEELRLRPVPVWALFDEILPVLKPEAEKHHVRVVVDAPATQPEVNGDDAMLRQALLNLAINACQAMPEGGTLRLTAAPASDNRVAIRIEDTGTGIPPEHLERIFDLYFTTKDHGTGIGLSMVYRIVQMHDGEVEVQSTPGRGTTFTILLPRAHEA